MTEPRVLPIAAAESCCVERCRYSPRAVRRVLALVALVQADDADLGDVLASVLNPCRGYENGRSEGGFGPTMRAEWGLYIHDVHRAMRAGCRTPEQISAWLCPFSDLGAEDAD